jgi:hypothetical protein
MCSGSKTVRASERVRTGLVGVFETKVKLS